MEAADELAIVQPRREILAPQAAGYLLRRAAKPVPHHLEAAKKRIALIGTGNIAAAHANALSALKTIEIIALVEPNTERAAGFAKRVPGAAIYADLPPLIERGDINAAHVLVPPAHHASVAAQLLACGIDALIEKPMAASAAESAALSATAQASGAALYTNHNFVFHPAYVQLAELVRTSACGPVASVDCTYAMPLRQLQTGQFHHWMFARPANLLLEQAVHPLSQVIELLGPAYELRTLASAPLRVNSDCRIPSTVSVLLNCQGKDAHIHLHFGATFPKWQISARCADGVIVADIIANTVSVETRTQWLEPIDNVLIGRRVSAARRHQDARNLRDFAGAVLKLSADRNPFLASMRSSISCFHEPERSTIPIVNSPQGAHHLVRLCEDIASAAFGDATTARRARPKRQSAHETLVIGGTGFIGRHIVKQLVAQGVAVGVAARHHSGLPDVFDHPLVSLVPGDITKPDELAAALKGAKYVINASAPELGATWAESEPRIRAAIQSLGDACLQAGVARLVHFSSTAAIFLGAPETRVSSQHPLDPRADRRALYARAKAFADLQLLTWHEERNLPVCILRPAIVVGERGTPYHTGVGLFVNGRHCLGWNDGRNALPFVLADDTASAAISACMRPGLNGRCYNLAGDVRLSAREYVNELAAALARPLIYHPQSTAWLWATEAGKWSIKRLSGRAAWMPSYRDLRSRAFLSDIDTSDAKHDLEWAPVANRADFIVRGIAVHAPKSPGRN